MLTELHIENLAVIEKADIELHKGFNVLTGETGAGKSIIVDSIGAVLGARTSKELVRTGTDKATVTAVFDSSAAASWLSENEIDCDGELIIQRRISADGKNSCRVCGTPVSVSQLRELGSLLLDIHGQNDGRQLMDESRHRFYLDSFGGYTAELEAHRTSYAEYRACLKEIERLSIDEVEKERLADSLSYQIAELERANVRSGEEDELSSRRDILKNSEKLSEYIDSAYAAIYGTDSSAVALTDEAAAMVSRASNIADELGETEKLIADASSLLYDAAERLRDFRDSLDFSPEEYDELESRISLIRKLRRKYNLDEDGLIARLEECRAKLDELEYSGDMLIKLNKKLAELKNKCLNTAAALTKARKSAARELEKRIQSELRDLSMPSVRFSAAVEPIESETGFSGSGADEVRFLISANTGEELGRISKIASGGELSRIMLAMKSVFSEHDTVDTMIFDEIDTGVSGIAAQRVGEKMAELSSGRQVLCITHLPQIAALADSHSLISKSERGGRTFTEVTELDREGRCREIARLYGGDNISELTLLSAEEQLCAADNYKKRARSFSD